MRLTVTLPSKCFVIGEYLVLDTGKALVINTEPRFSMHMDARGSGACHGVHPQSPAGQFIRQNAALFASVNLSFVDPHEGSGGFGASSAQFVSAYVLKRILESKDLHITADDFSTEMLAAYRRLLVTSEASQRPSGADVMAQFVGQLASIDLNTPGAEARTWPFKNYDFLLVRTGQKLPTHEHLAQLQSTSFKALSNDFSEAHKAMDTGDAVAFALALNKYQKTLSEMGLLAEHSQRLLEKLGATKTFTVTKACGAMGADVLFVMYAKENAKRARQEIENLELKIAAGTHDLTSGLQIHALPNREITKGPWL